MIVATTVDRILRLEEAAIVVVTEVEPEAMHLIELDRSQAVKRFNAGTDQGPNDYTFQATVRVFYRHMTLFLVLEELERRRGWINGPKKSFYGSHNNVLLDLWSLRRPFGLYRGIHNTYRCSYSPYI